MEKEASSKGPITEPKKETDPVKNALDSLLRYLDPLKEQPQDNLTYKEAVDFLQSSLFINKFKERFVHYLGRENMGTHTLDPLEEATFQTLGIVIAFADISTMNKINLPMYWGKNQQQIAKIKRTAEAITPLLREAISPQDKSQLLG